MTTSSNSSGPQQGLKLRSSKSKRFLGEPGLAKFICIFMGDHLHAMLQTSPGHKFWESIFMWASQISCFPWNVFASFPFCALQVLRWGVLFSALVLGNHWLQIGDHFYTFNKNTLDLRACVQMWDIAKTRLTHEGVAKTSSLHVVVLVIDHIWATSPPETKPSELSSLYKSTQVPRIREKALVWIEPARHRRTKAFPASGSNDLPLSSPHLPGPHRCADKVLANLPSHVVLPITHLLLHQALQPALQTPLLRLVFPPRTLPYSFAVASCWFAVYIFQTRAAWYVIWWLQLLCHGNKSAPSSCGSEWPRPSRLQ